MDVSQTMNRPMYDADKERKKAQLTFTHPKVPIKPFAPTGERERGTKCSAQYRQARECHSIIDAPRPELIRRPPAAVEFIVLDGKVVKVLRRGHVIAVSSTLGLCAA